jgi:hypothetical protein
MNRKQILALAGAAVAFAAAPAAAGATKVSVRVEGKTRTLLPPTAVQTHAGWITSAGAPRGSCSAQSGQGALDVATRHRWAGPFTASLGSYFIKKILGETENGPSIYWSIFVNNRSASTGACGIKLHRGDQLLFAAAKYPEYPIAIKAPSTTRVGHTVRITVVWFNAGGKAKPLPGATLSVAGGSGKTNGQGIVEITPTFDGTFTLSATHAGYIRAAPVSLRVTR